MIFLALIAVLAGVIYLVIRTQSGSENSSACNLSPVICPDGSYVEAQGERCQYPACPEVPVNPAPGFSAPGESEPPVIMPTTAEQLAACLPLSDMESKQTCDSLISQIQTFEDCSAAGFPVLERFPALCSTPDGRQFEQPNFLAETNFETNSSWEEIIQALNNCEVVAVMQTHRQEVTAELKDGRKLNALEPELDNIIDKALEARDKCRLDIVIATE